MKMRLDESHEHGSRVKLIMGKDCVCVLSYETLQKPGRSGDDDEELLHQLCDKGYLSAL